MTKSELVERCKMMDRDAMRILYSTYAARMISVIRKYVADKKASEDILHDGFIVVYTNLDRLRDPERLEYWMGSIMRNISLKYLGRLDVFSILGDEVDVADTPEADEVLSFEELDALIEKLPYGYKTIFRLAVLENKSHKEISKLLGITPSTSSSQLFHAKALLRKLIREYQSQLDFAVLLVLSVLGFLRFSVIEQTETPFQVKNYERRTLHCLIPKMESRLIEQPLQKDSVVEENIIRQNDSITEVDWIAMCDEVAKGCDDIVVYKKMVVPNDSIIDKNIDDSSVLVGTLNSGNDNGWSLAVNSSPLANGIGNQAAFTGSDDIATDVPTMQTQSHYNLPVAFGIDVARRIGSRISLNAGVKFTYLRGSIDYLFENGAASRNFHSYYLSIPLGINYRILNSNRYTLYLPVRAGVDIPIHTSISTDNPLGLSLPRTEYPDPQFFLSGGIGLQYRLGNNVNVYFEPSLKFYLNGTSEPSIGKGRHTEFSLPLGIRVSW